jgi:hypothetical protein
MACQFTDYKSSKRYNCHEIDSTAKRSGLPRRAEEFEETVADTSEDFGRLLIKLRDRHVVGQRLLNVGLHRITTPRVDVEPSKVDTGSDQKQGAKKTRQDAHFRAPALTQSSQS